MGGLRIAGGMPKDQNTRSVVCQPSSRRRQDEKEKNGGGRGPDGAQSRSGSDCRAVTSGGTVLYCMSVQCNLQTWLDYVGSHSKGLSRKECITEFCHLVHTHISAGYTSRTVFATCCLVGTRVWTVGFPVSPISSKRRRVLGQRREHHLKPVRAGTVSLRYGLILGSFSIFLARSAQVPPRLPSTRQHSVYTELCSNNPSLVHIRRLLLPVPHGLMINTVGALKVKVEYGSEQKYSKKHMVMKKKERQSVSPQGACVEGGKEVPSWWWWYSPRFT